MKLYVTVCDFGAAAHIGGDVERTTEAFDMPMEVEHYIRKWLGNGYSTIALSFDKKDSP